MDSSYPYPQAMGQSPFFYYNPDPKPDNRQHGHFSQQPNNVQVPLYHQHVQLMPPAPIYPRPTSSCSQLPMQPKFFGSGFPGNLTPMASPRPIYHRPTILVQEHPARLMVESDVNETDMYYNPVTPPLSVSGSVMSSPSTCDLLPTPVNAFFGVEGFEGVKMGCEGEVQSENLAGGEWAQRCGSPPMTPVYVHPTSLNGTNERELLSATSCPSFSPSPSPPQFPRSIKTEPQQQDIEFCDPRNLTVASAIAAPQQSNPALIPSDQFPPLPTLCPGDEEEHKLILGNKPFSRPNLDNFVVTIHGLPLIDQLSDLDSEDDDFLNGLVNFPVPDNVHYLGNKRQRTRSDLSSFDKSDAFLSEDEYEVDTSFGNSESFAAAALPSSPPSELAVKVKKAKRTKKTKADRSESAKSRKHTVTMNSASGEVPQKNTNDGQQHSAAASQSGRSDNQDTNVAGSDAGTPSQSAPVARRGRKQSITDDPSKTFICDLCNRRFRRQEHLKRHVRSLHTHDKPFECLECGKKFSRSDNLAQHSRTHGSGAIVMGVLEDGELPSDHMESPSDTEQIRTLGSVLFNVAASASGSDTDPTSDATNKEAGSQSRKKRKRSSE